MAEFISFQPLDHYNCVTYTGNGGTQAITGVGFAPDYTCIKKRDGGNQYVNWDTIHGAGDNTELSWSATNPIGGPDSYNYGQLSVFGSDGFTVAPGGGGGVQFVNTSAEGYASWNWKLGTTTGIDTTGATITPTSYSLNSTAKQSLIVYEGNGSNSTIPHGLGKAPSLIWLKRTSGSAVSWQMGNSAVGWDYYATPDNDATFVDNNGAWNDTAPTSVLFTVGTNGECNTSGEDYVALCFAESPGYMKVGKYTGNGNADGPFVWTGLRPGFLIVKRLAGSYPWPFFDYKREGFNAAGSATSGNNAFDISDDAAETSDSKVDLLSSGFKVRNSGGHVNSSGVEYAYWAMAEFPMVSSNDIPGVAR